MPALLAEKEPYAAAVVGTLDRYMGRHAAQVKLQGPKVAIVLVGHLLSHFRLQPQSCWQQQRAIQ